MTCVGEWSKHPLSRLRGRDAAEGGREGAIPATVHTAPSNTLRMVPPRYAGEERYDPQGKAHYIPGTGVISRISIEFRASIRCGCPLVTIAFAAARSLASMME